jgi:hypothetical protein
VSSTILTKEEISEIPICANVARVFYQAGCTGSIARHVSMNAAHTAIKPATQQLQAENTSATQPAISVGYRPVVPSTHPSAHPSAGDGRAFGENRGRRSGGEDFVPPSENSRRFLEIGLAWCGAVDRRPPLPPTGACPYRRHRVRWAQIGSGGFFVACGGFQPVEGAITL